ncbi:hypothetical protein GCM10027063_04560 [Promicromonospora xylanilytica]
MTQRVVFHIGAPKTGTTFLQQVLFANKARLEEHGVLVPGEAWGVHAGAAAGLRQGPGGRRHIEWRRLLTTLRDWPGDTAIVSCEWFPMATVEQTAEALEQLQEIGELHVVATARDLVDQVPGAWQEFLKLGHTSSIDEFAATMDQSGVRWCWDVLDIAEALERWGAGLPPEQVHVVTLPPRGAPPGTLWNRFATACGIDPSWCSTDVKFARESISVEAARLLQLAGPQLRAAVQTDSGKWNEAYVWIQRYLSHDMLLNFSGSKITMSGEQIEAVRARSERSIERLRERGYDLVGDFADLTSSVLPQGARHPDTVTDAEVFTLAAELIPALLDRLPEERRTPIALHLVAEALGETRGRKEPAPRKKAAQPAQAPAESTPSVPAEPTPPAGAAAAAAGAPAPRSRARRRMARARKIIRRGINRLR